MVYKFFDSKVASPDKKSVGSGAKHVNTKLISQNEQLADELYKPIIRKFKKRKVYSTFKDNIWGADLADMQLLSKYNKGIRFLLCVIDIFSKYAWVVPVKDKKGINIIKAFQSILKQSNRKPNKIWVDKGSEFHNAYFKKWLQDNDIVMYSTHNEEKSVVAERFIRTLKSKIYKYMTLISKNVYIDKLDDIVDEFNNTYHTTIKMKPADVKDNTALLMAMPANLISFCLASTYDTLLSPINLKRWRITTEAMCTLCSKDVCTTAHILGACKVALQQGRYTFRHDTVLHQVIEALQTFISNIKEAASISAKSSIMFVKKGAKVPRKRTPPVGILHYVSD